MKATPEILKLENALAERAAGYWLLGAAVVVLLPHVARLAGVAEYGARGIIRLAILYHPARLAGAQPLVALVAHRAARVPALPTSTARYSGAMPAAPCSLPCWRSNLWSCNGCAITCCACY